MTVQDGKVYAWRVASDTYHDQITCSHWPRRELVENGTAETSREKPKGRERCDQCKAKERKAKKKKARA